MLKKIFARRKSPASQTQNPAEKDIIVRIINPSQKASKPAMVDEADVVKEYKEEVNVPYHVNLVQGLLVGAGVGFLICVTAIAVGLSLAVRDAAAIVAVPTILGLIMGHVFS